MMDEGTFAERAQKVLTIFAVFIMLFTVANVMFVDSARADSIKSQQDDDDLSIEEEKAETKTVQSEFGFDRYFVYDSPPLKVEGLNLLRRDGSSAKISWDNTGMATGYKVYRNDESDEGEGFECIGGSTSLSNL